MTKEKALVRVQQVYPGGPYTVTVTHSRLCAQTRIANTKLEAYRKGHYAAFAYGFKSVGVGEGISYPGPEVPSEEEAANPLTLDQFHEAHDANHLN